MPSHRFCIAFALLLNCLCIAFALPLLRLCIAFASPLHRLCIAFASLLHRPCITFESLLHSFYQTPPYQQVVGDDGDTYASKIDEIVKSVRHTLGLKIEMKLSGDVINSMQKGRRSNAYSRFR
jgi:hypothetical protein